MKLRTMKPAESRAAAVLLLLVVLALAYFILLHWWFVAPLQDINAQMDDLRDTQSRYASAIAQKPLLQKAIASLDHTQADSSAFLPESDPNAASAGLMQHVVDVAAANAQQGSCEVAQKMPVPGAPAAANEPYRKVVVSISLHCDMQPLIGLLYTLEKGKPDLFVQDFSVYRNPLLAQQKDATAPLEVQFTLAGYVHASAADATPPPGPRHPHMGGADAQGEQP